MIKKGFISITMIVVIALVAITFFLIVNQGKSSPSSMNEVAFQESFEYIVNPYMGAVAPAKYRTRQVDGSLVTASYTWRDIELEKGVYDFRQVENDNNFFYWTNEMNNNYVFIFQMDVPKLTWEIGYDQMDIPLWLYEELRQEAITTYTILLEEAVKEKDRNKIRSYTNSLYKIQNDEEIIEDFNEKGNITADIPGVGTFYRYYLETKDGAEIRGGFSPNYSSKLVIDYHRKIMETLAERYDNEVTYAVIMGSLGHWGEMHTHYIQGREESGRYPVKEIAQQYENVYAEVFENVIISSRYPREVAKENNFGLHSHSFGDHFSIYDLYLDHIQNGYTDYYTKDKHPGMPEFWRNAPSGGEFLYTGDQRYLKDENIESTIKQAEDTHLTWFNEVWYGLDEETEKNQNYFFSKIGYRFVLDKARYSPWTSPTGPINIELYMRNTGTAPFYKEWEIRALLIDENNEVKASSKLGNINELKEKDEKIYKGDILLPRNFQSGVYTLKIGIFDPEKDSPRIKLAINKPTQDFLYNLGEITIR
ncbi:hypothetical protein J2Z35_001004 [Acetoanaerobium pronyense]|uniref:DUF4832 domain-containing protein n=1 Tax=Acetoanaerobium pronyense TaxID=1482736 RepID=A0ABS4KIM5_9FIRM|nr:DUF4832 domain-containing protein [Acetoanaerobium pronyense]MBP2027210.1 hypothetical protein [Acetoanaerobium pronyense]